MGTGNLKSNVNGQKEFTSRGGQAKSQNRLSQVATFTNKTNGITKADKQSGGSVNPGVKS